MLPDGPILTWALDAGFVLLVAAMALAFLRLARGPSLPDVLIRMHASTKAGTLGCGLIPVAAAVHFGETGIVARAVAAIVFLMLTAPVAAHMIGGAAYRTGVPLWKGTVIDELAGSEQGWDPRDAPDPSRE